jgi:hypothetical protein
MTREAMVTKAVAQALLEKTAREAADVVHLTVPRPDVRVEPPAVTVHNEVKPSEVHVVGSTVTVHTKELGDVMAASVAPVLVEAIRQGAALVADRLEAVFADKLDALTAALMALAAKPIPAAVVNVPAMPPFPPPPPVSRQPVAVLLVTGEDGQRRAVPEYA